MNHRLRARVTGFIFVSTAVWALGAAVGCSDSATSADPGTAPPATTVPSADGSAPGADANAEPSDASADTGESDAGTDGSAALQGCAAKPEAAFCDDFDDAEALKPGKTKWDFIEPSDQPVATLSEAQKVSAPSSLLSRVIDGSTPGAKFAKTITKAGFTETTWEYDVFLESIGTAGGFFLDDFQFSDSGGTDAFGFRLVVFANAGAIGEVKVEHNQPGALGPYIIEPALPAGQVVLGKWHHFKQTVKFAFASGDAGDAGDAGAGNSVEYTLTIDDASVPTFQKKYAGLTRQQTTFARIAGMPLVFNKGESAGLKIYWDNHALELK